MERVYQHLASEHFQEDRQMLFLMGPRQVGKTTTSQHLTKDRGRSLYLNWDNFDHQAPILGGPSRLASELGLDQLRGDRPLLVLDEIHKFPRWRRLLKGFFDTYSAETDILVTGSARLQVFNTGGESLMGRYFGYRMHPLSVAELARPSIGEAPGERPPSRLDEDSWAALLEHGGFPEPLTRQSGRFSQRWRRLRHQQLLREELRDLTRIQEVGKVQTLAQLIVQRCGQLTSYSTLANSIDASIDSVKRWLKALENLYFCFAVRPWFRNVARSLRKEPKIYLWDWSLVGERGGRFENLVACALLKACHFWTDHGQGEFGLYFVRDKEKREVDFLISRNDRPWLLVEAKSSGRAHLSPHLLHHSSQLGIERALQVAADLPYMDRDCFQLPRPMIVPARTFLSQLI